MPKQQPQPPKEWKNGKNSFWYLIIFLISILFLSSLFKEPQESPFVDFSAFLNLINQGKINKVIIQPNEQLLIGDSDSADVIGRIRTYYVDYPDFMNHLQGKDIEIEINPSNSNWIWSFVIQLLLPIFFIGLLWFFIIRQTQGANSQAMSFGKSRALPWKKKGTQNITFKDVAGVNEAVEELEEIVEFLKEPKRYLDIGAKIPKGALLMGPPGTGKTLLAKAIAGEADVPFFSLSGSDFVEMFVGVGASRVRDLFKQAKKTTPCIIFVDEIDAVGRHRGAGLGGGHDEREQTLNQLLVEMDGFDPTSTVIVIAATNRPDILDPALLRPGRFDRQIIVDKPDVKGRMEILTIHANGKKFEKDIDFEIIAKRTPGFTGADLANLLNEAALLSARKGLKTVHMSEIEESTDRVMAGPERKSRIISEKEKELVAYHEVGHALVAYYLPGTDPIHKISILPRGQALGYTLQLPIEDKHLISKTEIENQITILLGGRIAEELIFKTITSGASNDIERATDLARSYICQYGMSTSLGPRKYGRTQSQVFLGKDYSDHSKDYSDETSREIDLQIKTLIGKSYKQAQILLTKNKTTLVRISKILIEQEVIDGKQFSSLLLKKTKRKTTTSKT